MTTLVRRWPVGRGALTAALAVVALVLLFLGPTFGRAEPDHNYRPPLPVDAIESGCYPLPGGARLDGLAYQVRRDTDVTTAAGERRRLRGHYDLVDRGEAQRLLVEAFRSVGFTLVPEVAEDAGDTGSHPDGGSGAVQLRADGETVRITVRELPDTDAETLVRGEFVLDLPVVAVARPDDPTCDRPSSTKRWPVPSLSSSWASLW
ncbi:hypothetical protein ACFQ0K_06215 [Nocardioides caeni]|uniref:Uncharacterized protein n=1 Tax=Nocardioides caeni TaxID=574700 RepID=A0A4S8NDH3_9ACTN|nr:hypothetical protein [Nocardioides caeni]THV12964.1 hypothetical protein E9934_11365 [Nocardioides caeni]